MANAIKFMAGSSEQMEDVQNDKDVFDTGITVEQFTKWAARVFVNCEAEEFIEGIREMMKADRPPPQCQSISTQEEEDDEEEELASCGPVETLDLQEVWGNVDLQGPLHTMMTESRYSIWRSMKGRQLIVDMTVSAKFIFEEFASQVEHQRRKLTKEKNPLMGMLAEAWPPQDAEGQRAARCVLETVLEKFDTDRCADVVRKKLVLEYISQVNQDNYASQTLKDQMQALVLAASEVLVNQIAEDAYEFVIGAYDF